MDYYGPMSLFKRFSLFVLLLCALGVQAQKADSESPSSPSSALDSELFYRLLLGELELRAGEPGAAYSLILDAARKTSDTRLYQRAVDIARQARSGESALAAARAWKQALPASREANRYLLQILIDLNRIGETSEPLKREVATSDPKDRAAVVSTLPRYFARAGDKKQAALAVERALTDYLATPTLGVAAWTVIGRMRFDADDNLGALDAVRKAQAQDSRSDAPVLLALSMMGPKSPQAEAIVRKHLEGPAQPELRMGYARALLDTQRYAEASAQLQIVTAEKPDYAQAWLVRGVLELQQANAGAAEVSLKRFVDLTLAQNGSATRAQTERGLVQAYFSLSQLAEKRKDFAQADAWLQRIDSTADLLTAQLRRATLLARQGKVDEARNLIHRQPIKSADEARLTVATEVQLLRDAKQYQSAYDVLAKATAGNPDDFDFVYDMAMTAEKLGNLDEMERLLRSVISRKPDYQHAYNALGYSLAQRNLRLPEARQLILKALEFTPGDPFISDSLAWVEFRAGRLEESLLLLQAAFKERPDAEIAAHMGEVLWAMGRRDQAMNIWKEGVKINADNETLLETLTRLRVKL
jgi:tetratricopeptide (TPR) repeat protein